jgi:hypothetical protein
MQLESALCLGRHERKDSVCDRCAYAGGRLYLMDFAYRQLACEHPGHLDDRFCAWTVRTNAPGDRQQPLHNCHSYRVALRLHLLQSCVALPALLGLGTPPFWQCCEEFQRLLRGVHCHVSSKQIAPRTKSFSRVPTQWESNVALLHQARADSDL